MTCCLEAERARFLWHMEQSDTYREDLEVHICSKYANSDSYLWMWRGWTSVFLAASCGSAKLFIDEEPIGVSGRDLLCAMPSLSEQLLEAADTVTCSAVLILVRLPGGSLKEAAW